MRACIALITGHSYNYASIKTISKPVASCIGVFTQDWYLPIGHAYARWSVRELLATTACIANFRWWVNCIVGLAKMWVPQFQVMHTWMWLDSLVHQLESVVGMHFVQVHKVGTGTILGSSFSFRSSIVQDSPPPQCPIIKPIIESQQIIPTTTYCSWYTSVGIGHIQAPCKVWNCYTNSCVLSGIFTCTYRTRKETYTTVRGWRSKICV